MSKVTLTDTFVSYLKALALKMALGMKKKTHKKPDYDI